MQRQGGTKYPTNSNSAVEQMPRKLLLGFIEVLPFRFPRSSVSQILSFSDFDFHGI